MTKDGGRVRVAGFADQPTRPATLLRGDIEEGLWNGVDGQVEIRFGTSPVAIVERGDVIDVTLETKDGSSTIERFDLVIGADGLRSTVRKLVFGPHEKFMHSLDAVICAYQVEEQMETF
ncbi:MAG TPA: oxidoreductase, partial [Erythrobacter sp.]|nr:oxidoreductase [Erythrobacter sp.]